MANALDLAIRISGKDAGARAVMQAVAGAARQTSSDIKAAGASAMDLARSIKTVTANALKDAGSAAQSLSNNLRQSADATDDLRGKLEGVRNAGVGIATAGGGALILAHQLREVSKEGEAATAKLDAMLKKRGEGGRIEEMTAFAEKLAFDMALPDDDPINDAAAGLAGFGMKADEIKRIMPGLIGQSRLYGQSLESVSEAVGRAFGKGDIDALARIGVTLGDDDKAKMKAVEDAPLAERQRVALEILQKSFKDFALSATEGMSAAEIATNRAALEMDKLQSSIGKGSADAQQSIDGIVVRLLRMGNAAPGTGEAVGKALTWGGYAAASAGSIIGLAAQLAMLNLGLGATGKAAVLNFGKMAIAGVKSLGAITLAGAPLWIILGLIAVAIGGLIVAWKGAQDAGTMSAEALRAKWGPLAEIWIRGGEALEGIAATLMGINNQKQGDAAEKATYELEQKSRAKRGLGKQSFDEWKNGVVKGAKVGEGGGELPSAPGAVPGTAAPSFNATDAAAQIAKLSGQIAPITGNINVTAGMAGSGAEAGDAATGALVSPRTSTADDIRAMQRELKTTTDKDAKKELSLRIFDAQTALKEERNAERAATKEERERKRAEAKEKREQLKKAREAQRAANKEQQAAQREQLWALKDEYESRVDYIEAQRRANKITKDQARQMKDAAQREYELAKRDMARGKSGGAIALASRGKEAMGAKWGALKGVAYGTGQAANESQVAQVLNFAKQEKDPDMRAYYMRQAGRIMDSTLPEAKGASGGRRVSVGANNDYRVKNQQEVMPDGNVRVTFEPIIIRQPSLTGRF